MSSSLPEPGPSTTPRQSPRHRIAIFAREPVGTGVASVALESARRFKDAGHEVRLVVDTLPSEPTPGIRIDLMPFGAWLHRWKPTRKLCFQLRHLLQIVAFSAFGRWRARRLHAEGYLTVDHNLEAWGGDIVVVHNVFLSQFRADRRPPLRRLRQCFNPVFLLRLARERSVLASPRVRAVVGVSPETLRDARALVRGDKELRVIRSGVNASRYLPVDAPLRHTRRLALGVDDSFVLLFVGHEFERKRLDLVLHALSLLPAGVVLWVIGGRMSRVEHYIAMCDDLRISGRVRFMGTKSDPEAYYPLADALVLPSDYETWGLVVVEAMSCGTPVLMTRIGCADDVIRAGENGWVIEPDPVDIAKKIRLLMASPTPEAHRQQARRTAEALDWSVATAAYLDLFDTVAESRNAHPR